MINERRSRLGKRAPISRYRIAVPASSSVSAGRELTGYEVKDLQATLAKAKASGAVTLVEPHTADGRTAAMVQFPGGYIAEIHALAK